MANSQKFIDYISQVNIDRESVVTIGNFDGLHIGHIELINLILKYSKRQAAHLPA